MPYPEVNYMNSTIYIVGLVATVFFIVGYFSLKEVCLASPVQVVNLADVAARTHSGHSRPNPGLHSGQRVQSAALPSAASRTKARLVTTGVVGSIPQ